MLTSAITTEGWWARPLRNRSLASPACATTSNPASVSSRAIPSRSSTSSSPITTRSGSDIGQPYRATSTSCLSAAEELSERHVGEVGLIHERPSAGEPGLAGGGDVPVDGGENDPRAPRQRRELPRERDPVPIGQLDVEQDSRGL